MRRDSSALSLTVFACGLLNSVSCLLVRLITIKAGRSTTATARPPIVPVLANPFLQGLLEADVFAGFFGFDPFMAKDFFALGQVFLINAGAADKLVAALGVGMSGVFHFLVEQTGNGGGRITTGSQ